MSDSGPTRPVGHFLAAVLMTLAAWLPACTKTEGLPVDLDTLGYRPCQQRFECGAGRYCNPQGLCWADCRGSADCALIEPGSLCDRFGQCVWPQGDQDCTRHEDCGPDRFCNGVCSSVGAACGGDEECPIPGELCRGKCAARCGTAGDCVESCQAGSCSITGQPCADSAGCPDLVDQLCTPIGLCMPPGWERWFPPGLLPPTACNRDAECKLLGWGWHCDCDKQPQPPVGLELCVGGAQSVCVEQPGPLDFGAGPAESPAHALTGVWGLRLEIAVTAIGLPIVGSHNTYSSNLFLVKASHHVGDLVELEERLCEVNLINFRDDDTPYTDYIRMVIPQAYLRSLDLLVQTAEVTSIAPGAPFATSESLELRGCVLADPRNDPLPDRLDFERDPADARIWDQDEDGLPGMSVIVDGVVRGKIFNVQRWGAQHVGQILDLDHIRGLTLAHSQEKLLSASNPVLIYDTTSRPHSQANRTYFRMQRVDDRTNCAALIEQARRPDSWLRHTDYLMDLPDP